MFLTLNEMRPSTHHISLYLFIIACLCMPCPSRAATDSAEANFMPWSGWYWPTNSGGLATGIGYRGHPSPMEKYELLKEGSYPGQATQFEQTNYYNPDAPGWYGQCPFWASASVYEHIEFYPSSIENIIFYVGDKKGLLTACHQTDLDIRANSHPPEVFHWWLLHYIKDNGLDFHANLDSSGQVWHYPVYRYDMDTIDHGDSVDVTCQIWYVDDLVDPDIQGSVVLSKVYSYTLYKQEDEITGGEWTGASVVDHPQMLVIPLSPGTDNPYLDYDFILDIAASRDDYLESNEPVELNPGGYNLILINEDVYAIECDTGDYVVLSVEKIDDFEAGIQVLITDGADNQILSLTVDSREEMVVPAESPPYTITLSRDDYGGGGVYRMEFDLKKSFEFANTKIQKGFDWGGFAITNTRDTVCGDVRVVGYREDGSPMETYIGPFSLSPGEKRAVLVSDLEVRNVERNDLFGIKILAPRTLGVVNLSGYFERNMSCYNGTEGNSRLIIPDTSSWWNFSRAVSWGIYNALTLDSSVHMSLFSGQGELIDVIESVIPANKANHYNGTSNPFDGDADGGWVLAESDNGFPLKGYVEWLEDGISKAEALYPLRPGIRFFVPHVEETVSWGMKVTLINVEDAENQVTFRLVAGGTIDELQVTLTAREKMVRSISELFPAVDGHDLNASALLIHAGHDIAGFYTFETPNDDIYFPLLDREDIHRELLLPHVASDRYWWTGINLFNPFGLPVQYFILPYDGQGNLMNEHLVGRVIQSHQKDVFTVESLFGPATVDVSFLKFQIISGMGLAGVFGYGNSDYTMLSGGVLK